MCRLIRMNIYQMLHSKCTWVLMIILAGIMIFVMSVNKIAETYYEDDTSTTVSDEVSSEEAVEIERLELGDESEEVGVTVFSDFVQNLQNGIVLLFVMIFTVLFVNASEKNGFIKNIATTVKRRGDTVLPMIITIAIYILAFTLFFAFITITLYMVFYPGVPFGITWEGLATCGLLYLLTVACMSFTALITGLCRNTGLGMTAGVLVASGFPVMITTLLNQLLYAVSGNTSFDFNLLLSSYQIQSLPMQNTDGAWTFAIILALIYLVLWNGIHILIVNKRDVA